MIEARTGFNVFNHLDRVIPLLHVSGDGEPEAFQKFGAAKLRVFGSAQHPIALGAAFVMLTPLALYLARRYRQRRWWLAVLCWWPAAPPPSRAPGSSCSSSSGSCSSGCGRERRAASGPPSSRS